MAPPNSKEILSVTSSHIYLWHLRYGHLHFAGLYHLSRYDRIKGLPLFHMTHKICVNCMAGKQHMECFPKSTLHRAPQVLELIHTDLVGPFKAASLSGSRYFIVFTDDFSCKSWVYFMKQKEESFQKFREFKAQVENETYYSIITLRSDSGGEYMSHEFNNYYKTARILQQFTCLTLNKMAWLNAGTAPLLSMIAL
jgi:hypothetical protein